MPLKHISLLLFFVLLTNAYAQDTCTFFKKYDFLIQQKEVSTYRKEAILDSLLAKNKHSIHQEELARRYYTLLKGFYKKNLEKSIEYALKIQEIGEKTHKATEDFYIKNNKNLVNLYYKNRAYSKVIEAANQYLKKYPNKTIRQGVIYRILGKAYSDIGDFENAALHYDKALYIFKKLKNLKEEGRTLIDFLEVYVKQKNISYSNVIINTINRIDSISNYYAFKKGDIITKELNAGVFFSNSKKYSRAKKSYRTSLKLSIQLADTLAIFKSLNNLGIIYKKENNIIEGKKLFNKASIYAMSNDNKASIFNNLADIFMREKKYKKALKYYDKAIKQLLLQHTGANYKKIEDKALEVIVSKIDLLTYLIDKGNALLFLSKTHLGYLKEALEIFELADRLIDIIYFESREDLSKLFWRERASNLYLNATTVSYKLQQPEKAFYFIEKSKAFLLLESITQSNAKRFANLPVNLVEKEYTLLKKMHQVEADLLESQNYHKKERIVDSVKNQVFIHKQRYSNYIDSLQSKYPRYYNYKKKIAVLSTQKIQRNIEENEIILQYKLAVNKGYLSLLTKDSVKVYELENIKQIHQNINAYQNAIIKPFTNEQDIVRFKEVSNNLYHQLFPFTKKNIEAFRNKRIIVIPDGQLQYIPLEPLIIDKELPLIESYLLNFCTLTYAYSCSSLMSLSNTTSSYKNDYFSIIPITFKNQSLSPLLIDKNEIEKIKKLTSTNLVVKEAATKQKFLNAYGQSKIIHISTHGGLENNNPWLAFNDDKLMLSELYFNNKNVGLVVLSACKTSQGVFKKGEGVMSIARGFINAGAQSVISSFWDINQKSSNEIIFQFYKNLKNNQSKSKALNLAKLRYLKKHKNTSEASPYYWSSIVLTGTDSVTLNNSNYYYIALVLCIFLFYLYKRTH